MTRPGSEIPDPLHTSGGLTAAFANVNSAEAWGARTASPLGWTFFEAATEFGMRRALADFGALPRSQVQPPPDRNLRFLNVFYGRPGSNMSLWRSVMDRIWGSSGAGYDEAYHAGTAATSPGHHPDGTAGSWWRFVGAAVRGRIALAWYRRRLLWWWRARVRPGSTSTIDDAKQRFREAADYNRRVVRTHTQVSFVGQSLLERLKARCAAAGLLGLELELVASDGEFEEQGLIRDLWAVSRHRQPLDRFLARWGFQGPVVGELSSRSWREDPSPLLPIIDAYRAKPATEVPARLKDRQRDARRRAQQRLLAAHSLLDCIRIRILIHEARRFIPFRQVGRSTFLKTYDVARCMARRIGEHLVADGVLTEPDDVFFLTQAELLDGLPDDVRSVVRFRRQQRAHYETLGLPERWTGELTEEMARQAARHEEPPGDRNEPSDRIAGLGVSPGLAEGRAIVVSRADEAGDLAHGDILVCVATDPSWAAILYAVDALVTDVGAQMSHGAIVARELGIPAVVNTRTATRHLRTGDRIRVDGTNGLVEILGRAPAAT